MRRLLPLILASLTTLALAPTAAHAYTFYEWDVPTDSQPTGIAQAGDFLYFTLVGSNQVGRTSLNGVQSAPVSVTQGAALWTVDKAAGAGARISPGANCAAAPGVTPFTITDGTNPADVTTRGTHVYVAVDDGLVDLTPNGASLPGHAAITLGATPKT